MATYAQLKKQIEQLSKQADAARQLEKSATLTKVREAIAAFELTVGEVFGSAARVQRKTLKSAAPKRTHKGAGQPKYCDPKSGAVWTGFGRAPAWLASAKDRTKFLIVQSEAAEAMSAEKAITQTRKKVIVNKTTKDNPAARNPAKSAAITKATRAVKMNALAEPKITVKAPAKKAAMAAEIVKPTTSVKASPKPAAKVTPLTIPDPDVAPPGGAV